MKEKVRAGFEIAFKTCSIVSPFILLFCTYLVIPWIKDVNKATNRSEAYLNTREATVLMEHTVLRNEMRLEVLERDRKLMDELSKLSREMAVLTEQVRRMNHSN